MQYITITNNINKKNKNCFLTWLKKKILFELFGKLLSVFTLFAKTIIYQCSNILLSMVIGYLYKFIFYLALCLHGLQVIIVSNTHL